ncbi:MAG: hypothetical protein ACFFCS_24505 [Candidatus Hodarchaeota archaeon]
MVDHFPELNDIELSFSIYTTLIEDTDEEIPEGKIEEYALDLSTFNKALNDALKDYSKIDYINMPTTKIEASAHIKYAYDLFSLLTEILRIMEKSPRVSEIAKQLLVLEEFLLRKNELVQSTYLQAARKELESFHDPGVRATLDRFLQKKLQERKGNGD